jgi:allophanate hydrolase subunit 2
MKAFEVLSPGGFTTVQDKGRFGFQQMGVPVCGVLDTFAADMANHLVGNDDSLAVLEITVTGPSLRFLKTLDIAVTGAAMDMTLNTRPVGQWRSIRVTPDDVLTLSQVRSGCRDYLAVSGGIQIPADEQPIILLVEQTVGGYAKIATVISTDIPKLAQTTPGDTISFEKIDLSAAHRIYLDEQKKRADIKALDLEAHSL